MAKLYDKDGNEVEAFLPEEIDQKVQQEKEIAIAEANSLREEEISSLIAEKEKLEEDRAKLETTLEGLKNKDVNFGKVRSQVELKDKKIEELEAKLKTLEEGSTKAIEGLELARIAEVKTEEILNLAGKDAEMVKKISLFYDTFAGVAKTKDEIKTRVANAYLLATGGKSKVPLSGQVISNAGGDVTLPDNLKGEKLTDPGVREVAKKLNISDQELAKFGLI